MQANAFEIQSSQIALSKSRNPQIQQLAGRRSAITVPPTWRWPEATGTTWPPRAAAIGGPGDLIGRAARGGRRRGRCGDGRCGRRRRRHVERRPGRRHPGCRVRCGPRCSRRQPAWVAATSTRTAGSTIVQPNPGAAGDAGRAVGHALRRALRPPLRQPGRSVRTRWRSAWTQAYASSGPNPALGARTPSRPCRCYEGALSARPAPAGWPPGAM